MARRRKSYAAPKMTLEPEVGGSETTPQEVPTTQEESVEARAEKVSSKPTRSRVKYVEMVYVGTADISTVRGAVTGRKYTFVKDAYRMPKPTKVDERDYLGILALKGKGCVRRNPNALFMSKTDWNLEIEQAKGLNR